ncbi:MAG TPA: ribonuclease HII [Candidatus Nealsonbacteria bacterium]|uniref:Ribonuclease HII n=1 Tax=marine sediment metagenome TaxID=412755 RepID=A0A0F9WNA8_9ZZZZ|nr:ribonuclease HII [Candidatus Nealsonbacteria bacterium]HEB46608.1 ribonuclease HII [Candidatus Nealsonbacteria bacterium]
MRTPYLKEEKRLWKKGYKRVACLDEAGRGPLAGPVVAAAVTLKSIRGIGDKLVQIHELKDSKKLTSAKREKLYKLITKNPVIEWQTARVSEKVIDKINIKNAAELAMFRAVQKLKLLPDFLIIDGKFLKNNGLKNIKHRLIIKADEKVFSCIAASIVAKVTRDRIMQKYHEKYPRYGFNQHKGYPTEYHKRMLKKYGICKIHRKTYKPIAKLSNSSIELDFLS